MKKRASKHLASYERGEFNSTKRAVFRLVNLSYSLSDISERKNFKVLDVGCGRGELADALSRKKYEVWGVDIDKTCVKLCQEIIGDRCMQLRAENLRDKFEDKNFNVIIFSHSSEHMDDPLHVVKRTKNLTDHLVIAIPNPIRPNVILKSLKKQDYSNPGHLCCWDRSHFKVFLEERCGLEIIKWEKDIVEIPILTDILSKIGMGFIKERILPKALPYFSASLIVLAKERAQS